MAVETNYFIIYQRLVEVSQPSGQNEYIKVNLVLIEATTTKKKKINKK